MVVDNEWASSKIAKLAKSQKGVESKNVILSPMFWTNCSKIISISEPLVRTLRMVDGDKKPSMGYLYEAMRKAMEKVKEVCNGKVEQYGPYLSIIDRRWKNKLCKPIHVAAYFLNPQYQYSKSCKISSISVQKNFLDVLEKLYGDDVEAQVRIAKEVMLFRNALQGFQCPMAIAACSTMLPGK